MAKTPAKKVRVRMAPSPTGPLHIGTARTTLFNWLFARHHGGTLVLRIEDTDKERSKKEYDESLLSDLLWLGLEWDEGPVKDSATSYKGSHAPYRQSERTDIYKKYLEMLLEKKEAYYCYCSKEDLEAQRQAMLDQGLPPKYGGRCRNLSAPPPGKEPEVIRFKVPEIKVEFKDLVRGKVTFDAALFGDQVIAKDLESPLYNFAVVVDDELMEITHVIRGEDHISNTPKQILMQRALGFHEPIYAHIPLILNPDRTKMSKRIGDVALAQYREKGYLPEALVNFIALLGWHPKGDQEVLSQQALIEEFDIDRIQPAGAIFNTEKLDWLNREYMKAMPPRELAKLLMPFLEAQGVHAPDIALVARVAAIEAARAKTLHELAETSRFFFALPLYDASLLVWKDSSKDEAREVLTSILHELSLLGSDEFTKEVLVRKVNYLTGDRKRGAVLWPLRVAVSGLRASPDPIDIMEILGKDETIERLKTALAQLS